MPVQFAELNPVDCASVLVATGYAARDPDKSPAFLLLLLMKDGTHVRVKIHLWALYSIVDAFRAHYGPAPTKDRATHLQEQYVSGLMVMEAMLARLPVDQLRIDTMVAEARMNEMPPSHIRTTRKARLWLDLIDGLTEIAAEME